MSVSLSICPVNRIAFWQSFTLPAIAHSACGPRVTGQTPWVAVWYPHPYVSLFVGLWRFCICINFRYGGPALRCSYPPNWGLKETSGVQSSLYVFLFVSLFLLLRHYFAIMHTSCNFMRHAKPSYDFSPHTGSCRTPVGSSWAYPPVEYSEVYPPKSVPKDPGGFRSILYVSLYVWLSSLLFGDHLRAP